MTNQAKVGIFATAAVVIFVLGFYFLKGTNLFERSNVYYAVYDRIDGLYKSNLVEINGFPVGKVGGMERDNVTGKIVVRIDLDKDLKIPDTDSTVAILVSTDFFGTKKIKLFFGQSSTYLKDGDTINTSFKSDLTERLGDQIDPIMGDVKRLVPTLDSTVFAIRQLFNENNPKSIYTTLAQVNIALQKISLILDDNRGSLKNTIGNLESLTGNIEKNNAQISNIINNFSSLSDSLKQANLKQTIENLNVTIAQLNGVVTDINQGKGTLGKLVKDDALYASIDTAVSNLNVLVKDVKARPYRYISINVFGAKKAEKRRAEKYDESGGVTPK